MNNADRLANAQEVVLSLVKLLKLKVSSTTAREALALHPDSPSMLAISDVLNDWNIENMAVSITATDLAEIPLPAIAHLSVGNGDYFVVVTKVSESSVKYFHTRKGDITVSKEEFCRRWDGKTLLLSASENSGELNYAQAERMRRIKYIENYTRWILLTCLFISPILLFTPSQTITYLLNIVGATLSLILLQKQFGFNNTSFDSICKMSNNSDCNTVIHDPRAKLFGSINLSEIGLLYFIGSLLASIVAAFYSTSIEAPMLVLSALSLPFALGLIYVQRMKIKKWCPICLMVIGTVFIKFSVDMKVETLKFFSWSSIALVSFSFSTVVVIWMTVRQYVIDSQKFKRAQRHLNRLLKNDEVFQRILLTQPTLETGIFSNEITTGLEKPQITITIVSNPNCGPCNSAHTHIDAIAKQFADRVKIVFRFAINLSDTKSEEYQVVAHILSINKVNPSQALQALDKWYKMGRQKDLTKWKDIFPMATSLSHEEIFADVANQVVWATQSKINSTPTILIDGQLTPRQFPVTELRYHVRKLLEKKANEVEKLV